MGAARRSDPSVVWGQAAAAGGLRAAATEYNLDDPLIIQYLKYMAGLFQGDFGTSFRGQEVSAIMADAWPVTLQLARHALLRDRHRADRGHSGGLRKGSFIDNLVLVSTTLVVSIPIFVLGFTAQLVFGVKLGWFPSPAFKTAGPRTTSSGLGLAWSRWPISPD